MACIGLVCYSHHHHRSYTTWLINYCSCYKFLYLILNGSFTPRPLTSEVNMPTPKRWAQTQVSLQSLATGCGKLLDRWAVGPLGDTSWTDSVSESSLGTWFNDFIWFNSMTLDDSFWRRWDRHEPFRYTAQRVRVELKFNWPRWETEWDRATERDFMMFWRQCAWLVPSCDSCRIV